MLRQVTFLFLVFFLFPVTVLILSGCAHQVSPEGGPRDATPPAVTQCTPSNFSTRMTAGTFRIEFDEFVELKNPLTEIYVSPPMKSSPDTRLRGRSLIFRFNDSLAPGTTYSVNFGNALADLTEGNILAGFRYVFSTGDYLDSLSLRGTVTGAFDRQPQKDVFVGLYLDNNDTIPFDSLPLRVAPYYITKTDPQGTFAFHNLRPGPIRLFALADQNSDLIFNQPSEKIAFCDSMANPYYLPTPAPPPAADTLPGMDRPVASSPGTTPSDSLRKADSVRRSDSVQLSLKQYPLYPLALFEQHDSVQRILKSSIPLPGMALLVFRYPVKDLRIVPLNFDSLAPWHLTEPSRKGDTVRIWFTRPGVDSLTARVTADRLKPDTLRLGMAFSGNVKKQKKGDTPDRLSVKLSTGTAGLNQFRNPLTVEFSSPLARYDLSAIRLIDEKDTVIPAVTFTDSLKRKILVNHSWQEFRLCRIWFPDSVFFGLNGLTHDTVRLDFRTRGEKDFGSLVISMNLANHPGQRVIQLMNEKESVIYEEKIVEGSQKITFPYLTPGRYKLKEINDRNRNGRWDSGNYPLGIQPEEVRYFQKSLEIRGNWEVEETWN